MSDHRAQAVKDVVEMTGWSERFILDSMRHNPTNMPSYAVSQRQRVLELEAEIAQSLRTIQAANDVIEAARCIQHWHDAMKDGSGMVVSAEHVRTLWEAMAAYDALAGAP